MLDMGLAFDRQNRLTAKSFVKFVHVMLFCSIALLACGQKNGEYFINEDATHTTRVVYKDGVRTLKERLLKTDTGYAKDGIREEIFDDGTKQVEYYKMGRPDSLLLVYYPSGVLKEKFNVFEGNLVGPVHTFIPSGKLESFAWFFYPLISGKANEPNWSIVLDSTGVVSDKTGRPISSAMTRDKDSRSSDSVTISFLFAPSPDSMRILFLISSELKGKKTVDSFTTFNEIAIMKVKLLDKKYPFHKHAKYSGIYLLLDNKDRIVVSDTVAVEQ